MESISLIAPAKNRIIIYSTMILSRLCCSLYNRIPSLISLLQFRYTLQTEGNSTVVKQQISQNLKNAYLQRMVISAFVFSLIAQFDTTNNFFQKSVSIRQALMNKTKFKQFIVSQINQGRRCPSNKPIKVDLEWLQQRLDDENFQIVLDAFNIKSGYELNASIWTQKNMLTVMRSGRVTLNPIIEYHRYFKKFFKMNVIFSPWKNTGTSFMFVTYSHLTSFYHKIPFKIQEKEKQFIQNFISRHYIPSARMVYINATIDVDIKSYMMQLIEQFEDIYPKEQILAENQCFNNKEYIWSQIDLGNFFGKLRSKNRQLNIFIVIDQAEIILRLYERVLDKIKEERIQNILSNVGQNKGPYKFRQSKQYLDLLRYNKIIDTLYFYSKKLFFNSAQLYNHDLFNEFTKQQKKDIDILDDFKKDRKLICHRCSFGVLIKYARHHIQLYRIMFYQIQVACEIFDDKMQMSYIKEVFDQTFFSFKQKDMKDIVRWKYDIRFLHIRQYIQGNRQNIASCLSNFMRMRQEQKTKLALKKYFQSLKIFIQNERLRKSQYSQNFIKYIKVKADHQISLNRHFLLLDICLSLMNKVNKNQGDSSDQQKTFTYKVNNSNAQNQLFCEMIKLSSYDKSKNIIFEGSPQNLLKIFTGAICSKQYNATLRSIFNTFWLKQQIYTGHNQAYNKVLNNFYRVTTKLRSFKIVINDVQSQKQLQFAINDSVASKDLDNRAMNEARNYLKDLMVRANSSPQSWFAGYSDEKNINKSYASLFDHILIKRRIGQEEGYEIVVFNWRMRTLQLKDCLRQKEKQIQEFFQKVQFDDTVRLTIYVVAPRYNKTFFQRQPNSDYACQNRKPKQSLNPKHSYSYKFAYFDVKLPFSQQSGSQLRQTASLLKQMHQRNRQRRETHYQYMI